MIGDRLCECCRAAATALSKRHADGSLLPIEDYNIELEDQGGHKVQFGTETDQRYFSLGLEYENATRTSMLIKSFFFFVPQCSNDGSYVTY